VADEIITSRAGVRVFVVNTDAEGRMVMADLLAVVVEELEAQQASEPSAAAAAALANTRVHTVATLTGHAALAMGPYTALVDNGAARRAGVSAGLAGAGELLGDCAEVSSLRREDWDFVASTSPEWDVKQVNTAPSAQTRRGHQFPAAVLQRASGMDRHGLDSATPVAYTHIDIAGSGNGADGNPSGAPIAALLGHYVLGL
jgi:leucyl aminopeptidase